MADENIAAILYGPSDVRVEAWPVDEPKVGEVQVQVHSVGICGTDLHYWKSGKLFHEDLKGPMVLGHETSGVVLAAGEGVTNVKPGDRVHLHPAPACHRCSTCMEGNSHNCQAIKLGLPFHGSIRRICNHPAEWIIKLPEGMSMDEGALIEPWVVGVYASQRAGVEPGKKVMIVGAGAIGALTLLAVNIAGAAKVCVIDINQAKLDSLSKLKSPCIPLMAGRDPKETAKAIEEALGGKPDVSIDCSCTEPGITTAIYATKPCGRVVLAGLSPPTLTLPMMHAATNEIDIFNMVRYGTCYPRALALIEAERVDLKPLIGPRFPLKETSDALQASAKGVTTGFKVIIDCTQ